jgi:hypothetical protein
MLLIYLQIYVLNNVYFSLKRRTCHTSTLQYMLSTDYASPNQPEYAEKSIIKTILYQLLNQGCIKDEVQSTTV